MDFGQVDEKQQNLLPNEQQTANSSWQIISPDNDNDNINETRSTTSDDDTGDDNSNDNDNDNDNNNDNIMINETHNNVVTGNQINAKFHEYDLIENQLSRIQEEGLKAKLSIVNDEKQLKKQIKQSATGIYFVQNKNRNEEDTDTDDYKDLSSTTTSDQINSTTITNNIINTNIMPWYKNTSIILSCVGIGIISFVIYKVYFKPNHNHDTPFRWLQNEKKNSWPFLF